MVEGKTSANKKGDNMEIIFFINEVNKTFTKYLKLQNGQLTNKKADLMGNFKLNLLDENIKYYKNKGYIVKIVKE